MVTNFPPPRSRDDIAFCVTAEHREGGTWSAIGRTVEEAYASMRRQQEAFPGQYLKIRPPAQCGVVESGVGLVWRVR